MGTIIGASLEDFCAIDRAARIREIRQELDRIVQSPVFRDSLRLTKFLNFTVEMTLAGKGDRLKGYTIAVEALGRGSDFNPQTDAIVRVEAGRLRDALARYYSAAGRRDPLVIELPRGTYVPIFRERDAEGTDYDPAAAAHSGTEDAGEIARRRCDLDRSLTTTRDLVDVHRLQIAALMTQIEAVAAEAEALACAAGSGDAADVACRPSPPLLPTAPSSKHRRAENGGWPTRTNKPTS